MVKRLRHGPLKAETGVRFSHESPERHHPFRVVFFVLVTREENRSATQAFAKRCGVRNIAPSFPAETSQDGANSPIPDTESVSLIFMSPHVRIDSAPQCVAQGAEFAFALCANIASVAEPLRLSRLSVCTVFLASVYSHESHSNEKINYAVNTSQDGANSPIPDTDSVSVFFVLCCLAVEGTTRRDSFFEKLNTHFLHNLCVF